MWTDWQGTNLAEAKANLVNLRGALITGAPTSIAVSGVRVEYDPGTSTGNARRLIQELQDYIYKVEVEGWDSYVALDPAQRRPAVTNPDFL